MSDFVHSLSALCSFLWFHQTTERALAFQSSSLYVAFETLCSASDRIARKVYFGASCRAKIISEATTEAFSSSSSSFSSKANITAHWGRLGLSG